jgi:hypothetical protein
MRLMKAFLVVKAQPSCDPRPGFGDRSVGVQVYVFIFQASPQPLDEDVVHAPALAVHADLDGVGFQHAGEVGAGELTALIGVEDLRPAEPTQRLFQGIDAEVGVQRVRKPPGQRASDRIAKLPFEPFVVFDRPLPRGGVTVTRRRR